MWTVNLELLNHLRARHRQIMWSKVLLEYWKKYWKPSKSILIGPWPKISQYALFVVPKGRWYRTSYKCSLYTNVNGNAKRFYKTIMDMFRSVLVDSDLDKSFWIFAIVYYSFVRNRLPCNPHLQNPLDKVFGKHSDLLKMKFANNVRSALLCETFVSFHLRTSISTKQTEGG